MKSRPPFQSVKRAFLRASWHEERRDAATLGFVDENIMNRAADHIEAMKHLDPEGALSGLDLTDSEGMAIRAAVDLWGVSQTPPLHGNAAIRAALKDWLTGIGLWAHVEPKEVEK